ncbi:hypothetical protein GZH47_26750 [Paenibacillus rhizovicinus]|uniref:Glyoxalase/Bleomycin resistance-like N-terminal domain-containing protein n=1 Tax=Paenibacillus rhizovicinus TaxID=2704463 RepID=A0A6C0NT88_9BACL|nr:hypothetical protein [Paenibacillus rhizovicinus]QHW29365.1 hypothetical protein GZH47_26750 [Paenibacillus rhizovicinus]
MPGQIWINLPVQDLNRSIAFFKEVGFSVSHGPGNGEDNASLTIGDNNVNVMLFPAAMFEKFTGTRIADTSKRIARNRKLIATDR